MDLIHISELSWKRIKHPSEVVKVGDIVEVSVLKVDKASKKISLRLNDVQDNPWDNISDYYQEEDIAKGVVVRLATFGAFVEFRNWNRWLSSYFRNIRRKNFKSS